MIVNAKPGQILVCTENDLEIEVMRINGDWIEATDPYRRVRESKPLFSIHKRYLVTKDEFKRTQEALVVRQERHKTCCNEAERRNDRHDHHRSMDEVQQISSRCALCQHLVRLIGRSNCCCEERTQTCERHKQDV